MDFTCFFLPFNVAIWKSEMTGMAYIIFLLGSIAAENLMTQKHSQHIIKWKKTGSANSKGEVSKTIKSRITLKSIFI